MTETYPILSYPDTFLQKPVADVKNIDGKLQEIMNRMAATMYAAPGVGLAAVQINFLVNTILASGLTCSLILQALVNMAVVTATLPYAGVPLPFISYGGSSLVTLLAAMGLVQSVRLRHRKLEF